MVDSAFLNDLYTPLVRKCHSLHKALSYRGFPVTFGFFNGHYRRTENGYRMDVFPIPEVTVTGLCDIEISFDGICVSTKLTRQAALRYDYSKLADYSFEAFGVVDYLTDFYLPGDSMDSFFSRIQGSHESEIGFSFRFPLDSKALPDFPGFLQQEGFYY